MTIIADVGESCTLRSITNTYNNYGDATQTVGSSYVSGLIIPMGADSSEVKAGLLNSEDAIGIYGGGETVVLNGNECYCSLGSFVLQNVQKFALGGTIHHIEAELRRVTE